jgi:hypothetical protein
MMSEIFVIFPLNLLLRQQFDIAGQMIAFSCYFLQFFNFSKFQCRKSKTKCRNHNSFVATAPCPNGW